MKTSLTLAIAPVLFTGSLGLAQQSMPEPVPAPAQNAFVSILQSEFAAITEDVKSEIKSHKLAFSGTAGCADLALTVDQEAQLNAAHAAYRTEQDALKLSAKEAMGNYLSAVKSSTVTAEEAAALNTALYDAKAKLHRAHMNFGHHVMFSILNHGQREAAVGCKMSLLKTWVKDTCTKVVQPKP